MSNFENVKKFMEAFGQRVETKPQFPNEKTTQLRLDLIKEELNELNQAIESKDLNEVADALTDILYVTYGAGCAYGIDLDKCFKEVQRANMSNFEDVKKFMKTFGQIVRDKAQFPDEKTMLLRFDLIKEELNELDYAMKTKNLKEVADALTDILYVTYGAGCAYGINLDKCFKEVQRANMSKLGNDGKPIFNEKGKVMKGPNYSKPNLYQFIK